jgi:hypothetical protein
MTEVITDSERFSQADATIYTVAPMSLRYRITTFVAILLIVVIFLVLFTVSVNITGTWRMVFLSASAAFAAISTVSVFLIWFLGRPMQFQISKAGLEMIWPGRNRKLPKAAFYEVFPVSDTELGHLKRKNCIRGIFGCFGWAQSKYLGNVDAYITKNEGFVFVRLKNRRPLLLTPINPGKFIEELCDCISDDNS